MNVQRGICNPSDHWQDSVKKNNKKKKKKKKKTHGAEIGARHVFF